MVRIIRTSYDDAKERLMERFGLDDIQAKAILDMQLRRLQGLERAKLQAEYDELQVKIAYYNSLLADEALLMGVVKDELQGISDKWGDDRRTEIIADEGEVDEAELIEEEDVVVTISHLGYIKRVSADTYKTQRRGGKGITGQATRDNDFVRHLITCSTHDTLSVFTNCGRVYTIKAYEIPEGSRTGKGIPAINFLNMMQHERITTVLPYRQADRESSDNKYLIAVTKNGIIKKTAIEEYITNRKTGLVAIKLKEDDELVGIKESTGDSNVIIVTAMGKSITFSEEDVRHMGRAAGGVKGIELSKNDRVVSMELARKGEELLVVTRNGYGKRSPVKDYRIQARGGKGLLTYDKTKFDKTGELIGAMTVVDSDEIFLINSDGVIIRINASEVSRLGRTTQGVKIMRVDDNSEIVTMARAVRETGDDTEGEQLGIQTVEQEEEK